MRKLLFSSLILCFLVLNSLGAALINKSVKEITSDELTEIAQIDVSKYKQVRVAVIFYNAENEKVKDEYKKLFELKKTNPKMTDQLFSFELGELNKKKTVIHKMYVFGLEGVDEFLIEENSRTFLIDAPPSKLSIKVSGIGKHTVYVWGVQ